MENSIRIMIAKIIITFYSLSDAKLLTKALDILTAMTGNVHFPTPTPTLDVVADAISTFQDAVIAASGRDRTKVLLRRRARVELTNRLRELGYYIMFTANGDSGMLGTTGYTLRKYPQPVVVEKPNVKVENGPNSGDMTIIADGAKKNRGFVHQYAPAPLTETSTWTSFPGTARKYTVTGLERAKLFCCRVGVMGAKGQLVFSDVADWVVQ